MGQVVWDRQTASTALGLTTWERTSLQMPSFARIMTPQGEKTTSDSVNAAMAAAVVRLAFVGLPILRMATCIAVRAQPPALTIPSQFPMETTC